MTLDSGKIFLSSKCYLKSCSNLTRDGELNKILENFRGRHENTDYCNQVQHKS